jgi:hypothetical protein
MLSAWIKTFEKLQHVQPIWHSTNCTYILGTLTCRRPIHLSMPFHPREQVLNYFRFVPLWFPILSTTILSILDSCLPRLGSTPWGRHYLIIILQIPSTDYPYNLRSFIRQLAKSPICSLVLEFVFEAHGYDFPSPCWPLSTAFVVMYKYSPTPQEFSHVEH